MHNELRQKEDTIEKGNFTCAICTNLQQINEYLVLRTSTCFTQSSQGSTQEGRA